MSKRFPATYRLALLATALALVVIGLGAFTRLVHAGLGCPDWPTCYGHVIWPHTAAEIARADQAFPHAPVETDKTWPEMVHRYFAASLGLVTIALVVVALRQRRDGHPVGQPLFMLAFVILQGMFGMWTVTLKLWPQVVTAHLLGGFTMLALWWLLAQRLSGDQWHVGRRAGDRLRRLRPWAWAGLAVVTVQVALGGWTTSNYAALACTDLPTCHGSWVPSMDFANGFNIAQSIGPNYLGGQLDNAARIAIHYSHRMGALITFLYVGGLALVLLRESASPARRFGLVLALVLLLQVSLGLSNVYFHLPLPVAVAHNLGAATLLLTIVTLLHRLRTLRSG